MSLSTGNYWYTYKYKARDIHTDAMIHINNIYIYNYIYNGVPFWGCVNYIRYLGQCQHHSWCWESGILTISFSAEGSSWTLRCIYIIMSTRLNGIGHDHSTSINGTPRYQVFLWDLRQYQKHGVLWQCLPEASKLCCIFGRKNISPITVTGHKMQIFFIPPPIFV